MAGWRSRLIWVVFCAACFADADAQTEEPQPSRAPPLLVPAEVGDSQPTPAASEAPGPPPALPATPTPTPPAAAEPPDAFTPSPEFQEWISTVVREQLPHEYEKKKNWGH